MRIFEISLLIATVVFSVTIVGFCLDHDANIRETCDFVGTREKMIAGKFESTVNVYDCNGVEHTQMPSMFE